jgi:hypothetical protein
MSALGPQPAYAVDQLIRALSPSELTVLCLARLWVSHHRNPEEFPPDWHDGFRHMAIADDGKAGFEKLFRLAATAATGPLDTVPAVRTARRGRGPIAPPRRPAAIRSRGGGCRRPPGLAACACGDHRGRCGPSIRHENRGTGIVDLGQGSARDRNEGTEPRLPRGSRQRIGALRCGSPDRRFEVSA